MTSLILSEAKARRPARTLQQLVNAREKVFRPQWEFPFQKHPVATCPYREAGSDGILNFKSKIWSAPAQRSGDVALDDRYSSIRANPNRGRASLATARQISALAILSLLFVTSCSRIRNDGSQLNAATR